MSKIQSGRFLFSLLNNLNKLKEQIMKKIKVDGITLTNNEIKDIMKVITSLENRRI